jgi:Tol biopolymer transport system component
MAPKAIVRYGTLLLCALLIFMGRAHGQEEYFGKNKVQYKTFHWSFIQTAHFDIYFSDGGRYLAEFTASAAESAYTSITRLFRYQLVNRVPIIVYNSHNDFQQTNVVYEYLEEGIGGVTELFKNRVVIPFEGDYGKFRHVIHHELVHAVMNDMFYGGSIQSIISNNITLQLPLWISEGIAEYAALKWDTNSDMYMRDATVTESLVPIPRLYGYAAYRGGESVFWYLENKYGEQKIGDIMNRIKSTRNVEQGFRGAIGIGIEELSERWQKDLKVQYWPDIAKREDPVDYGRRLTDHKKDGGFYNTGPSISPQGDRIAFISNRDDYFSLYVMSAVDGTIISKLAQGQQTANWEELHLLTPGIAWSPDAKRLVVSTKAGEEDALVFLDIATAKQEILRFGLDGIFSVAWSPKGDRLAMVGNREHRSDIYVYDLKSKQLANLTDDIFSDSFPAWSPDGKTIYFTSDRGAVVRDSTVDMRTFHSGQADLYSIDVTTRAVTRLTDWPNSEETSVVVSPDGKRILFISDRNGINNIYSMDLGTLKWKPVTNSLYGVYQLSLTRDGTKLAFSALRAGGFDVYVMRNPFERDLKISELEMTNFYKLKYGRPAVVDSVALARTDSTKLPVAQSTADSGKAVAAKDSTGLYGKDIQIDFSNYVFKDAYNENLPSDSLASSLPRVVNNVDEDGNHRVFKYKLNFTPDIIYGNAGYDTFYGVTGMATMAFSDLLGDHQIVFQTNLLLDLKNSDWSLSYYYLPERIDYGFGAFHSARFVIINDIFGGSLYRFRTYGANVQAFYPVNKFERVETGLNWFNVTKENLDRPDYPSEDVNMIVPQLGYVYDTILWGYTAPINGTRWKVNLFGTPKLGLAGISFVNLTADYRTYLRLGKMYSIALRLAGGGSFGTDPQKFIIGGVSNWINRQFDGGYVPLDNAADYLFMQVGVPLRGYNYNAAFGTRYSIFNMEFRYPLFGFIQAGPLPIGLQSLSGVMFFDAGTAWSDDRSLVLFTKDPYGKTVSRDLLMGMGTGARIYVLAFLLKFDVAWAWNGSSFSTPKYYFSLGADF